MSLTPNEDKVRAYVLPDSLQREMDGPNPLGALRRMGVEIQRATALAQAKEYDRGTGQGLVFQGLAHGLGCAVANVTAAMAEPGAEVAFARTLMALVAVEAGNLLGQRDAGAATVEVFAVDEAHRA